MFLFGLQQFTFPKRNIPFIWPQAATGKTQQVGHKQVAKLHLLDIGNEKYE